MTLLFIAAGGAFGAVSRYGVSTWVQSAMGGAFPWGTMTVNLVGSLLLGFGLVWMHASVTSEEVRQLVTVGFLGSFTTFSTFSHETVALWRDGDIWRAGGYTAASVALGLLAVIAGAAVARALTAPGAAG